MTVPHPDQRGYPPSTGYGPPAGAGAHTAPASTEVAYSDTGQPAPADVHDSSLGDLVGAVTRDLSTLVRQEIALARAEITVEAKKAGAGAGMLGGAGFAGWFVLLFLSVALYAGLSNVMDGGWAALIVALLWAIVAGVLFALGRSRLQTVNPKPERTVETLSEVPEALKGHRGGTA